MIRFSYSGLISLLLAICSFRGMSQLTDIRFAQRGEKALTDVMIHDITSPPVASRSYVYCFIAFYEACRRGDSSCRSYANQLNGLGAFPEPVAGERYDWLLAGMTAFYTSGYAFVFSKDLFQQAWDSISADLKKRSIPQDVYDRSVQFGQSVAGHILKWAKEDGYIQTRAMPRFTTNVKSGYWKQTPPDYMEAVEPNWNKIRPMTMTSAAQFLIAKPAAYNSEKFITECREVYDRGNKLTKKQIQIADFWDCNPFATQTVGHFMYSVKKLSPAGHWIGITGVAINQKKQKLAPAMLSYSIVSVAIFDAIIAAWDEKYRSNYIRPVTAIQQLISPTWQPRLQTPPFPEYPSGHSVISTAAATMLTAIYGAAFRYTDNVERSYGLPDRTFSSFREAANEAAISRLYGGIHFREAIENGQVMGERVGKQVLEKIKLSYTALKPVP